MHIYVQCYEDMVMQRINNYLDSMEQIVKTEPQAVLTFNKFMVTCKDV